MKRCITFYEVAVTPFHIQGDDLFLLIFNPLAAQWRLYPLSWGRILVQVTIYRRLLIGRDGHLDQSEAYDIS